MSNVLTPSNMNFINSDSAPSSEEAKMQPLHQKPAFAQNKLLGHRLAASNIASNSPTDNMMSPCTVKLSLQKKKHYTKGKPVQLSGRFNDAASEN